MGKDINLENLSEEEASKLCLKSLENIGQHLDNINKTLEDTVNYCRRLDSFAEKYPSLIQNYFLSKN